MLYLQLCLDLPFNLHNRPSIRKHSLPALYTHNEPDLLEATIGLLPCPPHLRDQLVSRLDRRCEPRLELLHVFGLAPAESLQNGMGSHVPREQAVDDGTAEAHLLARLRVGVQGVVVSVETVNMCCLHCGLNGANRVRCAVGRWVARNLGTW